jgi:hypothetical protein
MQLFEIALEAALIYLQNGVSTVAAEGFKAPVSEFVRMKEYRNATLTVKEVTGKANT